MADSTMLRRKFGCYVSLSTTVTRMSTCNLNRLNLSHILSHPPRNRAHAKRRRRLSHGPTWIRGKRGRRRACDVSTASDVSRHRVP